jgi:membrane-bound lytic murein transglycosylase MltF
MLYCNDGLKIMRPAALGMIIVALLMMACESESPTPQTTVTEPLVTDPHEQEPTATETQTNPSVDTILPDGLQGFWQPWQGDFDGMVERRVVRVLTTYGGYQFYYNEGRPHGATYDMLKAFERYLNAELGRKHIRIHVLPVPLTPTVERQAQLEFSRPLLKDIDEVIVTGLATAPIKDIEDLSGREIFVRRSSSYYEHLKRLADTFVEKQLPPPILVPADELLEAEDIIEMISLGEVDMTIMDDYKADFWAGVLPGIEIRKDLVINSGGSIAWAMRKESPLLAAHVEGFLKKHGRGSLFGNDTYNRYLAQASRARCAKTMIFSENIEQLIALFSKYGEQYSIDWLRLAAQAYQESGLKQNRVSPAGAVGIMQIKPSTAADKNVGISDVSQLENNIHAGTKYIRFLEDRYFSGDDFTEVDQWLFGLAAYNAGPAKINRYRREAQEKGYDPNVWFDNVEIIAAQRIGHETVTYVSNIFKYYVAYHVRNTQRDSERF